MNNTTIKPSPLYNSEHEHDACGVGFIAHVRGKRSYAIVDRAVTGLKNLAHRGAIDADSVTGDGAGLLTQIPVELFSDYLESKGIRLYSPDDLGVGVVFLPRDNEYLQATGKRIIEDATRREGLSFLAWREVPVDPSCLGKKAELTRPLILQALVARHGDCSDEEFERKLFLIQKTSGTRADELNLEGFYIVSFSGKTIVYKGLLNAPQVRKFFIDLKSPMFKSAFAIFHQRFATNTFPSWHLAQPYRMLAHNGEINTIKGNRSMMRAREYSTAQGVWGSRYKDLSPLIRQGMSDSASFDNALQAITLGGKSVLHACSMMMPSAWEKDETLSSKIRAFYRHHSCILEPWDGPAAMVFTDGRFVAAALDRNGLRPSRYKLYDDDILILGSEAGLVPEWGAQVLKSGRLGPGRMIAVDVKDGKILQDEEIKVYLSEQADYQGWCERSLIQLSDYVKEQGGPVDSVEISDSLFEQQIAFGYDKDERELIISPMIKQAVEPIGSMGDDTPLAILSRRPRLLYTYFKQLFAQVTNPAIDSIRERSVMSLNMYLGGRLGLFEDLPQRARLVELSSPFLLPREMASLATIPALEGKVVTLSGLFEIEKGPDQLEVALKQLCIQAETAVREQGARVLILSDRGVDSRHAAIPMLLATGAVHQQLVNAGLRLECDLVCDTGEAREVHQFATLLGFGANAIHPWLAYQVVQDIVQNELEEGEELDFAKALSNYRKVSEYGLYKIMAKMGISTLFSYHAAQIFEALGLSKKVIDECFFGTTSNIGGIGYRQIAEETLVRHQKAFPVEDPELAKELEAEGYYRVNKRGEGEFHAWNPKLVAGMHRFIRSGKEEDFSKYIDMGDQHQPVAIKDLLQVRFNNEAIPLEEVEGIEEIRSRFTTAGMSLGAISPETHECLAIALNSIGGKSNSGEGGEDPVRFIPGEDGRNANSAIKQVASGRFGVNAEYLTNAREIEIKISQGAKPGEGGQLPGHKVSPLIARLRYSVPGVTLISPPPHHDIYSIEDLAQLIFDLKEVNPRAKVCVKLVSGAGIGTIAAGVAKAYADVILVSGHEGGTGASPLASIKNAGSAWEIGLAEAHQVLIMNDLRGRVTLRTDGGMKTGLDIVKAALLGAEEFNFGTAALIAAGCAMFRVCHLNICPVGIATQREDLRAKFRGKPENIIQFFNGVAEDVRRYLSRLGARSLKEVIGRTDLLEQIDDPINEKTRMVSLAGLLHNPDPSGELDRIHTRERNDRFGNEGSLDDQILQEAHHSIRGRAAAFKKTFRIRNINRCVGTRISGEIAYIHGNEGLAPRSLDLTFEGSAGQSFGTFLIQGVRMKLIGEANDYVGKGMSGGEIVVRPRDSEIFDWNENIILGNTCLYGATGGALFAAGQAGERFAVRNSGAVAVVEGVGDHACEYMTRGTVLVLGPVGRNFAAGMSGGLAFVYDPEHRLDSRCNQEMVRIHGLTDEQESADLYRLLEIHVNQTGSMWARQLLNDWCQTITHIRKVAPIPPVAEAPINRYEFVDIAYPQGVTTTPLVALEPLHEAV